jgi:3D-(3,5/4)-trihydroxycyclohexane-1,2-dione acylhydrolase (decyclizing)
VVVCVGTRLTDFTTASRSLFADPDVQFVGINVAAADARTLGALPVVADARVGLDALRHALDGWQAPDDWRRRVLAAQRRWEQAIEADLAPRAGEHMTQGQALRVLNRSARPGDWVVAAAGSPPGDLLKLWDVPDGGSAHIEFGFSCMGHELPAGIGIRLAQPDTGEVLVVIGDGTFLLSPTELVTAVQERTKIVAVVFANHGFQSIHSLQLATVGSSFGNEFRVRDAEGGAPAGEVIDVDHAGLARSLGCPAWRADTLDELETAIAEARAAAGPALIECRVEPRRALLGSGAWWDLGVAQSAVDSRTQELAAAHAAGAAAQRYFG